MIYIVGVNDLTEEYKLFNTDAPSDCALKRCKYDTLSVADFIDYIGAEQWTSDIAKLRLQMTCETSVEFKILYYSCDYDRDRGLLYNIRLHLTNGQVVHPDVLRNDKTRSYQEQSQLARFTGDEIAIDSEIVVINGDGFISNTNGDGGFSKAGSIFPYHFKVNGEGRLLSILSADTPEHHFSLYAPSYALNVRDDMLIFILGYDKATDSFTCVYRRQWRDTSSNLDNTLFIRRWVFNKWFVASMIIDGIKQGWDRQWLKPIGIEGIDTLSYLRNYVISNEIDSTAHYYNIILSSCIDTIQDMTDALSTFGDNTDNLKVVIDGELKTLVNVHKSSIMVDLSNIKSIARDAFYALESVALSCKGSFDLQSPLQDIQGTGASLIIYDSQRLRDKVYKEDTNNNK